MCYLLFFLSPYYFSIYFVSPLNSFSYILLIKRLAILQQRGVRCSNAARQLNSNRGCCRRRGCGICCRRHRCCIHYRKCRLQCHQHLVLRVQTEHVVARCCRRHRCCIHCRDALIPRPFPVTLRQIGNVFVRYRMRTLSVLLAGDLTFLWHWHIKAAIIICVHFANDLDHLYRHHLPSDFGGR